MIRNFNACSTQRFLHPKIESPEEMACRAEKFNAAAQLQIGNGRHFSTGDMMALPNRPYFHITVRVDHMMLGVLADHHRPNQRSQRRHALGAHQRRCLLRRPAVISIRPMFRNVMRTSKTDLKLCKTDLELSACPVAFPASLQFLTTVISGLSLEALLCTTNALTLALVLSLRARWTRSAAMIPASPAFSRVMPAPSTSTTRLPSNT